MFNECLRAVTTEMEGKVFRLAQLSAPTPPQWIIRVGKAGRPEVLRYEYGDNFVGFERYTNQPAMSCTGKSLVGTLVLEYSFVEETSRWIGSVRAGSADEVLNPYYEIFDLSATSRVADVVEDRQARAFDAPVNMSGKAADSQDPGAQQRLWIDTHTLLPLRWELIRDGRPVQYGLSFEYDQRSTLELPEGTKMPTCVLER